MCAVVLIGFSFEHVCAEWLAKELVPCCPVFERVCCPCTLQLRLM